MGSIPMTSAAAERLYNRWAPRYDEDLAAWGYRSPARVAQVAAERGGCAARVILDLGCGTGLSGQALLQVGARAAIVGVDVAKGALQAAHRKSLYSALVRARMDAPLPFAAAAFDAVVAVGSLGYVEDFATLFEEMCRVTAPGSHCVWSIKSFTWDERGCRTQALRLQARGAWFEEYESPAEIYLPDHPDELESAKTIRVLCHRRV